MRQPTVNIAQSNTTRLISSGRLKEPVLLTLAATQEALNDLAALESVTNSRLRAQQSGLNELDASELVFGRPGHTFINAAFTHTRAGGNRFNGPDRGAWYCAFELETAIDEVAYHLTQELAAIERFELAGSARRQAEFIRQVGALKPDRCIAAKNLQLIAYISANRRHRRQADRLVDRIA